jgi:hypothetical protein
MLPRNDPVPAGHFARDPVDRTARHVQQFAPLRVIKLLVASHVGKFNKDPVGAIDHLQLCSEGRRDIICLTQLFTMQRNIFRTGNIMPVTTGVPRQCVFTFAIQVQLFVRDNQ